MRTLDAVQPGSELESSELPPEVRSVFDALSSTRPSQTDRRRSPRATYRIRATMTLIDAGSPGPQFTTYTRDANEWGLGFVCAEPFPVGREATVTLLSPRHTLLDVRGCILRCREVTPDWFEGAIIFAQRHDALRPAEITASLQDMGELFG